MVVKLVVPQPKVNCCGLVTVYVGKLEDENTENVEQLEQPFKLFMIQCV